jgi:hypothetical protein
MGGGIIGDNPSIQIDGTKMNTQKQQTMVYEKIDGISDPQLLHGHHQNGYNLNSVWED